jgi:hypothetical protein
MTLTLASCEFRTKIGRAGRGALPPVGVEAADAPASTGQTTAAPTPRSQARRRAVT